MELIVVLVVLTAVAAFVTMPLRRRRLATRSQAERIMEAKRIVDDLEATREAKYREIRDAELDHATGKLSDADFRSLDGMLRRQAVGILKALDRAHDRLDAEADAVEQPVPDVSTAVSAVPVAPAEPAEATKRAG